MVWNLPFVLFSVCGNRICIRFRKTTPHDEDMHRSGWKKGKKSKSGNAIDLRVEMWRRIFFVLFISLRFYFVLGDDDDDYDDKQRHTYTISLLGYNSVGQQKISDKKERRKKFSTNEATATTNIKNYEHIFERRKMCFGIMLLSLPSQFCTAVEVNGFPFCVCVCFVCLKLFEVQAAVLCCVFRFNFSLPLLSLLLLLSHAGRPRIERQARSANIKRKIEKKKISNCVAFALRFFRSRREWHGMRYTIASHRIIINRVYDAKYNRIFIQCRVTRSHKKRASTEQKLDEDADGEQECVCGMKGRKMKRTRNGITSVSCSQQGEIYSVCASTYVMHQHSIIYGFNAVLPLFPSLCSHTHTLKMHRFSFDKRTSKTKWKAFNSNKEFKSQTKYPPHHSFLSIYISIGLTLHSPSFAPSSVYRWLQNTSSIYVKFIVYVRLFVVESITRWCTKRRRYTVCYDAPVLLLSNKKYKCSIP